MTKQIRINLYRAFFLLLFLLLVSVLAPPPPDVPILPLDAATLDRILAQSPPHLAEAGRKGDVNALYEIAKQTSDPDARLQIFHALADARPNGHVLSQVALGFHYYQQVGDKERALEYFVNAGEGGPHQAALYNAGRIYAELSEYSKAMGYIQAAILYNTNDETGDDSDLTQTCRQAYEMLSQQIAKVVTEKSIPIEEIADVFMYASETNFPVQDSQSANLWRLAILSMHEYNNSSLEPSHHDEKKELLVDTASNSLGQLWKRASGEMSKLQAHLVLTVLHDIMKQRIAAGDDTSDILKNAGGHAEALAASPYCSADANCFLHAIADATSFYRQAKDGSAVKRVERLAKGYVPSSDEL
jgi:tetratricopeptide (TPR) repeat protein